MLPRMRRNGDTRPRLPGTLIGLATGLACVALIHPVPACARPSELLSLTGLPVAQGEDVSGFELQTWTVQVLAVCRLPLGWTVTAGNDGDPGGVLLGSANIGAAFVGRDRQADFRSMFLVRIGRDRAQAIDNPAGGHYPAELSPALPRSAGMGRTSSAKSQCPDATYSVGSRRAVTRRATNAAGLLHSHLRPHDGAVRVLCGRSVEAGAGRTPGRHCGRRGGPSSAALSGTPDIDPAYRSASNAGSKDSLHPGCRFRLQGTPRRFACPDRHRWKDGAMSKLLPNPAAHLRVVTRPIAELKLDARNPRQHSKPQIRKIAASIERFGFNVADPDRRATTRSSPDMPGSWRASGSAGPKSRSYGSTTSASRRLRPSCWPTTSWPPSPPGTIACSAKCLRDLSVLDLDFSLELTGFDMAEIDLRIAGLDIQPAKAEPDKADVLPPAGPAVSQPGDLWLLDEHRVLCGNATEAESFSALMDGSSAGMVFTDPPYNVPIDGHVSGLGKITHREFAMALRRDERGGVHRLPVRAVPPLGWS